MTSNGSSMAFALLGIVNQVGKEQFFKSYLHIVQAPEWRNRGCITSGWKDE